MDFRKGYWNAKIKKTNLRTVDNLNRVDVILYINGKPYPYTYAMDERVRWQFSENKNESLPIHFYDSDFTEFKVGHNYGRINNIKFGKDKLVINKALFSLAPGDTFNPATETVGFFMDDFYVLIPPGSFTEKNNTYSYKSDDVNMKLDFNKNTWSIKVKNISSWSQITAMDGINVFMMIGDAVGAELKVFSSSTLKYRPRKTRYIEVNNNK
jgi:hypothetical protein